jgi:hypothetical protein
MKVPLLPLSIQNDIERQRSWEGISTPHDLALYMGRVLSVDPTKILSLQEIVYSDVEPVGVDRKKIWIKTDHPVGFGIPTGDGYKMIYQYPPNTPFIWTQGMSDLPQYLRALTDGEMSDYSLAAPKNESVKWVIYSI